MRTPEELSNLIKGLIEEYTPEVQVQDYEYEFYFDNDVPGPRTASSTTTTEDYAATLSTNSCSGLTDL